MTLGCRRTILALLALAIAALPVAAGDTVRCGRVRFSLPEGCRLEDPVDIDSSQPEGCEAQFPRTTASSADDGVIYHLGVLVCSGAHVKIQYDIGGKAGDYCDGHEPLEFRFRENGPLLHLCERMLDPRFRKTRRRVLALVIPDVSANFWSESTDRSHVMRLLRLGRSAEVGEDEAHRCAVEQ
jgi:hypothetical protein